MATLFVFVIFLFLSNSAQALTTGCISARDPTCDCSAGHIETSSSVSIIEVNSFSNSQLFGLIIPPTITSIEAYAFSNNHLPSVMIPSTVSRIGEFAFENKELY